MPFACIVHTARRDISDISGVSHTWNTIWYIQRLVPCANDALDPAFLH